MREIKFRGKRVDNGEWVYGSYLHFDYHNSVDYVEGHTIVISNGHEFEVDPKTVGQFIGFNDRNGVEIYEGQDVRFIPVSCSSRLLFNEEDPVAEDWETGKISYCRGTYVISNGGHTIRQWYDGINEWDSIENCETEFLEVIENPELLKTNETNGAM